MKFNLPDMSCGHCKAVVEKAIAAIDPAAQIAVDLETRSIEVTSSLPAHTIIEALGKPGYPAVQA